MFRTLRAVHTPRCPYRLLCIQAPILFWFCPSKVGFAFVLSFVFDNLNSHFNFALPYANMVWTFQFTCHWFFFIGCLISSFIISIILSANLRSLFLSVSVNDEYGVFDCIPHRCKFSTVLLFN